MIQSIGAKSLALVALLGGVGAPPEPLTILTPSQGRPVFCQPDHAFECLLHLPPDLGEAPAIWLQNSLFGRLRYPLLPQGGPLSHGEGYVSATVRVPISTPPGLYDVVLSGSQRQIISRRSVCVPHDWPSKFRFVHLSNMNIDDPTAPDFDERIPEEVNLLSPAFIVATGDYTEWARLRDRPEDWRRVLDYMARFQSPVYVLCGDHDHEASFTTYVANSLIGTIDFGSYHGLLLLDHGAHPIERDDQQIRWVLNDLADNRGKTFNFLVCHSDELGLIRQLRERNLAAKLVSDLRVRLLICGGHSDWDYREFASLLSGLAGLTYIRTAQSSSAVRDKATGESHYRVIEVNGDRISTVYPTDDLDASRQHSIPAGRIRAVFQTSNDGSADPVTVTIANGQNRPWTDCRIWLCVRKDTDGREPAAAGGRLLRRLDVGAYWACEVAFDLPDKGSVTVQAGTAERVTPPLPVLMDLYGPEQLTFVERLAGFGLTYYTSSAAVSLRLTNRSEQALKVWPVVRLNGANLPLSSAESLPIPLPARSTQVVRVGLGLGRLSPGPHLLQAYLLDDPLRRLHTRQVVLLRAAEPATTSQPVASPQPVDTAPAPGTASEPPGEPAPLQLGPKPLATQEAPAPAASSPGPPTQAAPPQFSQPAPAVPADPGQRPSIAE